jgi:ribosomal-protein-alanine N-acetyltransferase
MGFRAISLLKDFYEDTTEDAYLMQYRYVATPAEAAEIAGSRITRMAG